MSHVSEVNFSLEQMNKLKSAMAKAMDSGAAKDVKAQPGTPDYADTEQYT